MQKIINAIAISSGVVSLALIAGGVGVYVNRGKIIDAVKSQVMEQVSGALGSAIGDAVPDLTGPAIAPPAPTSVGLPPIK